MSACFPFLCNKTKTKTKTTSISTDVVSSETYLDFDDVMIMPQYTSLSSRSQVNLEREFTFTNKQHKTLIKWKGIPIIAANMDTTGTFEVYKVLSEYKMLTAMNKFYTLDDYQKALNRGVDLNPDYFMVSTGISDENFENLKSILDEMPCNWICIDVANGYMQAFFDFCKKVRKTFPEKIIVAGNVVTPEIVDKFLNEADIDIVKIGIGPGSACLTRKKTGVGIPQLTAIQKCRNEYIISDGGIKTPGDMAKAFGAGADFVMVGGAFAGHDENPGELIEENGERFKLFYGMSSKHAMEKHYGKMNNYRASEGAVLKVKYKGSLENTINDYLGGLRSACTYTNSASLEEFSKNVHFVRTK
jgi:GMP reductase